MIDPELQRAYDSAKVQLIMRPDSIFITTVLFSLHFRWDSKIPTACTDGITLRVNPEFFLGLTKEERVFLLAHEAWHVAFQHMARVSNRNFRKWNIATDYVINLMLVNSGFTFIKSGLLDYKYTDMSSDEVYALLDKKPPEELPEFDEDMEEVEGTPDEIREIEEQITDTIMKASMRAKMEGQASSIPGEIDIWLDKLIKPQLPWHQILAKVLNGVAKEDYSFRNPNKRFLPKHYIPGLFSESIGEIATAIDLSGSITQKEADVFISENYAIHTRLKPDKTHVVGFDTAITCEYTIDQTKDIARLAFKGGGGTDIVPVYEWANKHKPKALVIFTDGYFTLHPELIPKNMILVWVIHGNPSFKSPKGKVVHYKERKG